MSNFTQVPDTILEHNKGNFMRKGKGYLVTLSVFPGPQDGGSLAKLGQEATFPGRQVTISRNKVYFGQDGEAWGIENERQSFFLSCIHFVCGKHLFTY